MKTIETLYSNKSNIDSKNITNKSPKKVSNSILEKIENGVSLEDLDQMQKNGLIIFKYYTQITIHGLFDDLNNNYVFGYKNVFQNKNRSIGIKYNAIDEQKRRDINIRTKYLGFQYRRDSTSTEFSYTRRLTEETLKAAQELYNKINDSLFIGGKNIYIAELWGIKYICISFNINAIYSKNIEPFLLTLGATNELKEAKELERAKELEAANKAYEERREQEKLRKQNTLKEHAEDIQKLKANYVLIEKSEAEGRYIKYKVDYNGIMKYTSYLIYKPKGKKLNRINEQSFETLSEALNYKHIPNWNDNTRQRHTGYKIND
jgi:hypothetical protein